MDGSVGSILEALRAGGLDRRTLVVFSSDNGPWLIHKENGGSAGPLRILRKNARRPRLNRADPAGVKLWSSELAMLSQVRLGRGVPVIGIPNAQSRENLAFQSLHGLGLVVALVIVS